MEIEKVRERKERKRERRGEDVRDTSLARFIHFLIQVAYKLFIHNRIVSTFLSLSSLLCLYLFCFFYCFSIIFVCFFFCFLFFVFCFDLKRSAGEGRRSAATITGRRTQ